MPPPLDRAQSEAAVLDPWFDFSGDYFMMHRAGQILIDKHVFREREVHKARCSRLKEAIAHPGRCDKNELPAFASFAMLTRGARHSVQPIGTGREVARVIRRGLGPAHDATLIEMHAEGVVVPADLVEIAVVPCVLVLAREVDFARWRTQ